MVLYYIRTMKILTYLRKSWCLKGFIENWGAHDDELTNSSLFIINSNNLTLHYKKEIITQMYYVNS